MSVAWVGAGIGAAGLIMGQSNASDAASAQENAVNSANGLTQAQYEQQRQDNMPFLRNGTAASNELAYRLGLSTLPGASAGAANLPDRQAIFDAYQQQRLQDPTQTAYAGLNAGDRAAVDAVVDQRYNAALQAAQQAAAPTAENDPNYGSLLKKFDSQDLANDPIYGESLRVGLEQGTQAQNRQAAASGSLNSGATLKALARFSTDLGASLGNDAFNRDAATKDSQYNKLAGVSGSGQTASSQAATSGTNATSTIANNTLGLGNSRAAASVASTNSLNSGISSLANYYQNQQLLSKLNSTPANNVTIYGASGGTGTFSGY